MRQFSRKSFFKKSCLQKEFFSQSFTYGIFALSLKKKRENKPFLALRPRKVLTFKRLKQTLFTLYCKSMNLTFVFLTRLWLSHSVGIGLGVLSTTR